MSEPRGFVFRGTVASPRFAAFLDAPVKSARAWTDWASIGGSYYGFNWDDPDDVGQVLDTVDRWSSGQTYRQALAGSIRSQKSEYHFDPGGSFERGADCGFTISRALYGEDLNTTVYILAICRGIEAFLAPGESAWVVRRDVMWGAPEDRPVEAVIAIEPGRSHFVRRDDPRFVELAGQAQDMFANFFDNSPDDTDPETLSRFFPDDAQAVLDWRPTE